MTITRKKYMLTAIFSSLLFALLLVLSTGYQASAQVPTENTCNDMGCIWNESNCSLEPGNPNNCTVSCYYIESLSCQATSTTDCNNGQC